MFTKNSRSAWPRLPRERPRGRPLAEVLAVEVLAVEVLVLTAVVLAVEVGVVIAVEVLTTVLVLVVIAEVLTFASSPARPGRSTARLWKIYQNLTGPRAPGRLSRSGGGSG